MKKKLYCHIGFHKTGTSSLQEFFHNNRQQLLDNGVCYMQSLDARFPANVDLSWALNANPPFWASFEKGTASEILSYYQQQLKANVCDTVILSSEDFCLYNHHPQSINNLKTFLNDYEVYIVAYLREPLDFLISLYSHGVRAKAVCCDLKTHIASQYKFEAADYHTRLAPWLQAFGKDRLIIKKYDPKAFVQHNLVEDFFAAIETTIDLTDPIYSQANIGTHVWLIQAYIEIAKADMDENSKNKLLTELTTMGKSLPKVDKASYLLAQQDIDIFNKAYVGMKEQILQQYQLEF